KHVTERVVSVGLHAPVGVGLIYQLTPITVAKDGLIAGGGLAPYVHDALELVELAVEIVREYPFCVGDTHWHASVISHSHALDRQRRTNGSPFCGEAGIHSRRT